MVMSNRVSTFIIGAFNHNTGLICGIISEDQMNLRSDWQYCAEVSFILGS